jgi:ABC-2 type transport system ATP-binding protein
MKQKLALVCSLVHRPKILFLDEPTTGVDPVSRRDFWKILSGLLKEEITVLLTTPYLDEAERCNRVALMHEGKILSLDVPNKIKENLEKEVIEIVCSKIREAYKLIKMQTGFEVQMFGDRINVIVDKIETDYPGLEKLLKNNLIEIISFRRITPSLENIFIHLVKESE